MRKGPLLPAKQNHDVPVTVLQTQNPRPALSPIPQRTPGGPMKQQSRILHTLIFAMFVLLTAGIGAAQDGIKVAVPFNFVVGPQIFSAGDYTLRSFSYNSKLLQTPNGQILTIITLPITVESSEARITAKLVFHQYGGMYFLSQIWDAGNPSGRQMLKSPIE